MMAFPKAFTSGCGYRLRWRASANDHNWPLFTLVTMLIAGSAAIYWILQRI